MIGIDCILSLWTITPSDVRLNMMPLFHIGGTVRNLFNPILSDGLVISCNGFNPIYSKEHNTKFILPIQAPSSATS